MSAELTYLVWVTLFTALMWVPYIVNRIMVRGIIDTVGYPDNPRPMAPWAERMRQAHVNAVENLVVFAPLVLAVHATGWGNSVTAMACMVYFWARVVHFVVYTLKLPWLRTLAFAAGFGAQFTLAWQLLA